MRSTAAFLLAAAPVCSCLPTARAQLVSVGVPPGAAYSVATGVSADGRAVAAYAWGTASPHARRAYRWTPGQGLEPVSPEGLDRSALAISADGTTIVGAQSSHETGSFGAFISHIDHGFQQIGEPFSYWAGANAVTADGTTVVGSARFSDPSPSVIHAMRWHRQSGLLEDLGAPPGDVWSAASSISADGSVICGNSGPRTDFNIPQRAVRWISDAIEALPVPLGHEVSAAVGVSADGSTIVGWSFAYVPGWREYPLRWRAGVLQILVSPPGFTGGAALLATNHDGSVSVGALTDRDPISGQSTNRAAVWSPYFGPADLNHYLPAMGIDTTGWSLEVALDISADGRTVVGMGTQDGALRGFVLTLPPPCGTADFNNDADHGTDADIESFFACLSGNCCPRCPEAGADFNADGDPGTDQDIEAFFRVLAGGTC